MRKILCIMLTLVLCLSVFSGCSIQNQQVRSVVEINKENLWKYIEISYPADFVKAESDETLKCSINGVLEYAYYDDVVITFEIVYYEPGAVGPEHKSYEVEVTLNAAGNAEFEVTYAGIAPIQNGKGQSYESGPRELYWYNRTIRLKSVTGKVIYTV